jgi:hypothetical protein
MRFFFDESGDFSFQRKDFDAYVQAALICPDQSYAALEGWVAALAAELEVDELHATELGDEERLKVCTFLGDQPIELVAQATDTSVLDNQAILDHRLAQAARLRENLDRFLRDGGQSAEIVEWMKASLARAGLPQRISNSEYVQADFLIRLIHRALQRALVSYMEDGWRDDFRDFFFVLDGKLPGKLAPGEKFLERMVMPAISHDERFALVVVTTWSEDPIHPFIEKYSIEEGIDARIIFEHGLEFANSRAHAGLQLVDAVAHTVRRTVLEPNNAVAQQAFDALRPKLLSGGEALSLVTYAQARIPAADRYRPLVGSARVV